jgi:cell division protein FtsB
LRLRRELDDLRDYLDLLEARARNKGGKRYTTTEVKKKLGLD